jgi:hypothetical protein
MTSAVEVAMGDQVPSLPHRKGNHGSYSDIEGRSSDAASKGNPLNMFYQCKTMYSDV